MKEIQKEIVKKSFVTVFVANDGTEFNDKEQCKKYDESALGVLLAKYSQRVIKTSDEWSLFGFGREDNTIEIIRFDNEADKDLVLQIYLLENPHLNEKDNKDRLEKLIARMNKALEDHDIVFIGRSYDGNSFYFEGTRQEHINVLNNIDKPQEEAKKD